MINDILRLIFKHKNIDKFLSKYQWYKNLIYYRAQKIIGNR